MYEGSKYDPVEPYSEEGLNTAQHRRAISKNRRFVRISVAMRHNKGSIDAGGGEEELDEDMRLAMQLSQQQGD